MPRIGVGIGVDIPPIVAAGGLNPDAQAFITATGITNPTEISAINTLVNDLQGYGLWTKMKAIYPMVGGTSTTCKYNLKDPRDLDAAFRLVFNGGWTFSSTGATPNGTNGYADTKYNPNTSGQLNSAHLSYYSRTQIISTQVEMGSSSTLGGHYLLYNYNNANFVSINDIENVSGNANSNTTGFYIGNRQNSNTLKYYLSGNLVNTTTRNSSNIPNYEIYLACYNSNGNARFFSSKQTAFASIGDGLTDTEASNLYSAVQTYQNSLNRAV